MGEAELACGAEGCSKERLVGLCERAIRIAAGTSAPTGAHAWACYQMMLLLRAQRWPSAADIERRWRAAVRAVQCYPASKTLWLLQLAAWESHAKSSGLQCDEDAVIDLVETMEAKRILLQSDPLEAIA